MERATGLPYVEPNKGTVLMLVGNPKNKRVLSGWLSRDFQIIAPETFEESLKEVFDIGIVDEPALRLLAKHIKEARERQAPVFLPFILIGSDQEADILNRYPYHLVDEVVKAPADPSFLEERIIALLRLRQRVNTVVPEENADAKVSITPGVGQDLEARVAERTRELSLAQQRLKRELDRVNLLLTTSQALTASLKLDRILEALAEVLLRASGRSRLAISFFDDEKKELTVKATRGRTLRTGERFSLDALPTPLRESIARNKTMVVDLQSPETLSTSRFPFDDFGLSLSLPMSVANRVTGHVNIDEPEDRHPFDMHVIRVLEGIASQAAIVIENAMLHERAVVRARTLEAIAEIGRLMSGTLRLREALSQIASYAAILMSAPSSLVLLVEGEECDIKMSFAENASKEILSQACETVIDLANLTREPRAFRIDQLPEFFSKSAALKGNAQAILIPLRSKDTLRGLIVLLDVKTRMITSEDAAALRLFAQQSMTAISIAEAYEEEHAIADTLQEAILTMPHSIPGIEFGWLYRSATEAAQVGGDFYDLFTTEDNKVGIVIGDVSGKGLEAATLTSLVKNTIRAYAYDKISPSLVIRKTNDALVRSIRGSTFITAFFGILDTASGKFLYCNAGHPKPIIKRIDGTIDFPMVSDTVIGAFPELAFREDAIILHPGDALILYTDGTVEARNDGDFFAEERLVEVVKDEDSIARMPQTIFSAIVEFSNRRLVDDIAILSVSPIKEVIT